MWGVTQSDNKFFDAFKQHSAASLQAAELLVELFTYPDRADNLAEQIVQLEHKGDSIVHETMSALRATWITPFDRADIHTLISTLDDVLDLIHATSERMVLFEIRTCAAEWGPLAARILEACTVISQAVSLLNNMKRSEEILKLCVRIAEIENEGDVLYRPAIAALYKGGSGPLEVMKWREIYDNLERTLDMAADVADAIGGVVLEYA